jgi:hypothetical protein
MIECPWVPHYKAVRVDILEFIECYNGKLVNSYGYEYDLEQAITQSDFIIVDMIKYWESFVMPIADHIILRMMTERLR